MPEGKGETRRVMVYGENKGAWGCSFLDVVVKEVFTDKVT